jgi:hypothetical protein
MPTWEYAIAEYDGSFIKARIDFLDAPTTREVLPFLQEAGAKGWELCATLPSPTAQADLQSATILALVFKRAIPPSNPGSIG